MFEPGNVVATGHLTGANGLSLICVVRFASDPFRERLGTGHSFAAARLRA